MSKFTSYIKDSYVELTQKVAWPTWPNLQRSAIVVMVTTLIFTIVIFLMDLIFKNLMQFIYTL
ncbi:MAG: preprotein translocase subunit SecE [Bacteroidales bacterium]|nr:preprotein translocase subunit SecE [Bacteroidales bacterium]MCI2145310.1 preprotein translocase subunit SecE [Bacteroidales bacterium]